MAASVTTHFRAFISYRHTPDDRRWAKWLHTAIETYTVPRNLVAKGVSRRLGKVFRDEEELAASASLSDRITEALEAAEFLIVVCSPETPGSRWVNEEIKRFQALGRSDRVLALLVAGEPETAFPPALQDIEPLAADVRATMETSHRQAKKTALLKLNAAILGVDFDELRRRDDERARKRLIWLLSTSVTAPMVIET